MESTNSYQLKQEEDNYILSITMLEESIKLSCDNTAGQIYSKIFTLEDLRAKDQIFVNIQNAFDAIDIFDDILKNEKVRVVEDESGLMQILLYIASEDRNIELDLEKELGENYAKEEQGYNKEMQMGEMGEINQEQMGQNVVEENNANYYQDLNANAEPEFNVNANEVNVNKNNVHIQKQIQSVVSNYEDYKQTNVESTVNTNENIDNVNTEQFNMEEFLKGTQPEVNANIESNAQYNLEENNTNYIQNENENININNNANTEFNINNNIYYSFGQPAENTVNIENTNTNINANTQFNNNFNISSTQKATSQIQTQTQTQTTNIFTQPPIQKPNV